MNQSMELVKVLTCHFTNEKRTAAEMYPAIVSGIVTGESIVPSNSPRSLCGSQLGPHSS